MFRRLLKKKQIVCEKVEGDQGSQKHGLDQRVAEAPPAQISAGNNGITYWLRCPFMKKEFGSLKIETKVTEQQQRVAFSDGAAATTVDPPQENKQQKRKKKSFWRQFDCFKRRTLVHPVSDDDTQGQLRSPLQTQPQQERRNEEENTTIIKPNQEIVTNITRIQVRPSSLGQSLKHQRGIFLGFPNPGTNCYMNASLQTLLTLKEFVEDIKSQEDVLALCPKAPLMRYFLNIVRCHGLAISRIKLELIMRFKRILSFQAPEFANEGMKDAHEFLTAVLDQMRNLVPHLTKTATYMGRSYVCPVQRHLLFKMQNIRTCKGCGVQSTREEDFTTLSLDLIAGSSVKDMLNMHQMEKELEFRCQCGGNRSGLESRFLTLPKYLILHLKRFKFTENLEMVKLQDPIILCREMTLAGCQGDQRYSLVSVINHIGPSVDKGHYLSDGLHPDHTLEDEEDRWLHFNDIYVLETSGAMISELCTEESYVLVYQRRVYPSGTRTPSPQEEGYTPESLGPPKVSS